MRSVKPSAGHVQHVRSSAAHPRGQSRSARQRVRAVRSVQRRELRIAKGALIVCLIVLVGVLATRLVQAATRYSAGGTGGVTTARGQQTTLHLASGVPAHGQVVDGLTCAASEGTANDIHITLDFYANGRQRQVPAGIGIVAPRGSGTPALGFAGNTECIYPVHVHVLDNQIHVESPVRVLHCTLGQFFDLWGQPLSATRAAGYSSDRQHGLAFVVVDAAGHVAQYHGDPRAIPLRDGETVVILYNSPHVQLAT